MHASRGHVFYHCSQPSRKNTEVKKFKCNKCKRNKCKCGFKRSKLFCTAGNGTQELEVLPGVDFWQTVANLKVCEEDCSEALHKVTGTASVTVTDSGGGAYVPVFLELAFRIIDEWGKEVCRHDFNFFQDVPFDDTTPDTITLDFPFYFNCCDRPRHCESHTIYRLQVLVKNDTNAFVRDVAWEAIVWESSCQMSEEQGDNE